MDFKRSGAISGLMRDKLIEHQQYITEHGEDMPEIREWIW
jgi:xylulose-5-phosphate/fructose-6-phosphate phosphoketolase